MSSIQTQAVLLTYFVEYTNTGCTTHALCPVYKHRLYYSLIMSSIQTQAVLLTYFVEYTNTGWHYVQYTNTGCTTHSLCSVYKHRLYYSLIMFSIHVQTQAVLLTHYVQYFVVINAASNVLALTHPRLVRVSWLNWSCYQRLTWINRHLKITLKYWCLSYLHNTAPLIMGC